MSYPICEIYEYQGKILVAAGAQGNDQACAFSPNYYREFECTDHDLMDFEEIMTFIIMGKDASEIISYNNMIDHMQKNEIGGILKGNDHKFLAIVYSPLHLSVKYDEERKKNKEFVAILATLEARAAAATKIIECNMQNNIAANTKITLNDRGKYDVEGICRNVEEECLNFITENIANNTLAYDWISDIIECDPWQLNQEAE